MIKSANSIALEILTGELQKSASSILKSPWAVLPGVAAGGAGIGAGIGAGAEALFGDSAKDGAIEGAAAGLGTTAGALGGIIAGPELGAAFADVGKGKKLKKDLVDALLERKKGVRLLNAAIKNNAAAADIDALRKGLDAADIKIKDLKLKRALRPAKLAGRGQLLSSLLGAATLGAGSYGVANALTD